MILQEDTALALRGFLHSPHGSTLMAYLRANNPPPPIPVGGGMTEFHIPMNYGFGLGLEERLKQLEQLSEVKPAPAPEETPRLYDTRSLSQS